MALLCQKPPTFSLELDFAGSLEQVAASCVSPALKGKEEGAYGQSNPKADPEAEPRISSELILVQKFKLEDRVEFEHCDCTDTIHAVWRTLFPRKLCEIFPKPEF